MTESQRKAMIKMHKAAEKAYIKYGLKGKADQARKQYEKLEKVSK